jgi:hypothetical protein
MKKHHIPLILLLMISLFGCVNKKQARKDAGVWLEKNFPQQFEVIQTRYAENLWISSNYDDFRLVVQDKKDPAIAFTITWNIKSANGGISVEAVQAAYALAKTEVLEARDLLSLFVKNGFQQVGVGVSMPKRRSKLVDILLLMDTIPEKRDQLLLATQKVLKSWPKNPDTDFWVYFMDANYFKEEPAKVLNGGEVHVWSGNKRNAAVISFEGENFMQMTLAEIRAQLTLNLDGQYVLNRYTEQALALAETWADEHQKPKVYLRFNGITSGLNDKDHLAIDFSFPYFLTAEAAAAEPKVDEKVEGTIFGTFQIDQKTLTNVSAMKNF